MALGTPRGEKRIEHVALNLLWNAASVIRERDLDMLGAAAIRLDQHGSAGLIGETVGDGVEDEIGQHLPIGARITVECNTARYLKRQRALGFSDGRPHAGHDLLGCEFKVKAA